MLPNPPLWRTGFVPPLNAISLGGQNAMPTADDIIATFRSAAIEKGDVAEPQRDEELHARMRVAFHELQGLGAPGEAAFRRLLTDVSPHVRCWVAAALLARGDLDARRTLQKLATNPGLLGLEASTTLREHDEGRLRSPFE
jgi:hypothetical protein